ncbi:MAG: glycosyltransferase family 4 protein [Chloroflexi bacterium]|nr:glycosyltransferase family 4 protein [Chloroflexota bacterium]
MSETRLPLPGKFLFVAGINLTVRKLNSPAQRLPYALAPYLEQMDLVGYINFYGGPPTSTPNKLQKGVRNLLFDRVGVTQEDNIRRMVARRLPLPRSLDVKMQSRWIFQALKGRLARTYDVVIIAHAENAPLAKMLKNSGIAQHLIYNDWDYYPGYVEPKYRDLVADYEQLHVNLADGVASVSRPLQELRTQQGAKRTIVIPNAVEFEKFNRAYQNRKPHPPTLIYCGSVDARWGIDLAIRALPSLRHHVSDARVMVVGSGPAENELQALAKELGVSEHVVFTGAVPYEQLPDMMAEADIGLATSRQDEFRKYASPMKITEYMAAGLPVIASGGGEAEQMIDESRGGVHIAYDTEALIQAALPLLQNRTQFETMQQAALDYAHSRTWDEMGKRLALFMAEILRK